MAGYDLKSGIITDYSVSEDRYWSLFNFVFSDSSRKRNTYKFGFLKAILDNLFNGDLKPEGVFFSYQELFEKFTENYWNLVIKYDLRQMRKDSLSEFSKIEVILKRAAKENPLFYTLEFDSINNDDKRSIIKKVTSECKKYVIGALYADFEGTVYGFDLKGTGITIAPLAYEFMLKYKMEIEKLNYYAWAKFLEKINTDNALIRVIEKLEIATPRRSDLSIYREILRREFESNNCFYCGRKLQTIIHVDHFIPWSYVKDDKLWNFVLACPQCNTRKNNRLPNRQLLFKITERNKLLKPVNNTLIRSDFENYDDSVMERLWTYAQKSGLKIYCG